MTKAKEIEREVIENIEMERLLSVLRFKGELEFDKTTQKLWHYIENHHKHLIDNKKIQLKSKESLFDFGSMIIYNK